MSISHIEWTDATWNPTTGCDRVSPGCDNCYALTMAKRLKGMGNPKYQNDGDPRTSGPGFGITTHTDLLYAPFGWKKPRRVFVNSMSDLFHARVPREFVLEVWRVMAQTPQHTYQILTKRPDRMARVVGELCDQLWVLPNVWLGTSVEDEKRAEERTGHLYETPAAVRFLSLEPLLGPVNLPFVTKVNGCTCYGGSLPGIGHEPGCGSEPGSGWGNLHWVIVGGESGPGARPMDIEWARSVVVQCQDAKVPVFVKQLGSVWARDTFVSGIAVAKNDPKGGDPDWWPVDLRVREYPAGI